MFILLNCLIVGMWVSTTVSACTIRVIYEHSDALAEAQTRIYNGTATYFELYTYT